MVDANGGDIELFGSGVVYYYGIAGYAQPFRVESNSTSIAKGEAVNLQLELWTLFYVNRSCIFTCSGNIDFKGSTEVSCIDMDSAETTLDNANATSANDTIFLPESPSCAYGAHAISTTILIASVFSVML